MKTRYLSLWTLLAAGFIYAWLAWPLPLFFTRGIPASAHAPPAVVQPAAPGDHLQLLYHFQLAADMLSGGTPMFYNLYEFNTGDDSERFMPGSYYVPFSVFYAAACRMLGAAGGWNIAALISIWLSLYFTWRLAARFTDDIWIAGLVALAAMWLPFRWINLFGGSPAGFAMAWPPAIWLGIDLAVRRRSAAGGLLAGFALLMACWCDTHVFFFSALAMPAWALVALSADREFPWRQPKIYLQTAVALLPLALCAALALAFPAFLDWITVRVTGKPPEAAVLAARTLREVKLYSPPMRGLFHWQTVALAEQIYIGYAVAILLLAGGLALVFRPVKAWRNNWRNFAVWLMILMGIALVCLLAAGVRGPGDGAVLQFFRRIIPPYRMVRQTAKIFTIMPTLLAVGIAVGIGNMAIGAAMRWRRWILVALVCLTAAAAWESGRRVNPTIELLPRDQKTYAAVAEHAASMNALPRALVLPLWPGDSHYTSLYQHFALSNHIRMLNGYRPFVRRNYFTNIFERLVSVNQGWLTPEQEKHLADMDVRYIILHEDLFPEKVSPFPVTSTLRNLLLNENVKLLAQDESVWAFAVGRACPEGHAGIESEQRYAAARAWDVYCSARQWEVERLRHAAAELIDDDSAGGGRCLRLAGAGARIQVKPQWSFPAPELRWLLRARGFGILSAELICHDTGLPMDDLIVNSDEWQWLAVPADLIDGYAPLSLKIEWQGGSVDCDTVLLAAGRWNPNPAIGEIVEIPAPCFFHAGYIDMETSGVNLRREEDPQALIFYGPKLPMAAGRYRIDLEYSSPAEPGTLAGQFNIRQSSSDKINWRPVFAGYPADVEFDLPVNLPFHMELLFTGNADLAIRRVLFTRLE